MEKTCSKKLATFFENLRVDDPLIGIDNNSIIIRPTYWNYSFLTSFVPGILGLCVLILQDNLKTNLQCIAAIILSFYVILNQLRYYNTVTINIKDKRVLVKPNIVLRLFQKDALINFQDIQNINSVTDGFWRAYRRYVIEITLKNSQKIKLVSSKQEDNASIIAQKLFSIV